MKVRVIVREDVLLLRLVAKSSGCRGVLPATTTRRRHAHRGHISLVGRAWRVQGLRQQHRMRTFAGQHGGWLLLLPFLQGLHEELFEG